MRNEEDWSERGIYRCIVQGVQVWGKVEFDCFIVYRLHYSVFTIRLFPEYVRELRGIATGYALVDQHCKY